MYADAQIASWLLTEIVELLGKQSLVLLSEPKRNAVQQYLTQEILRSYPSSELFAAEVAELALDVLAKKPELATDRQTQRITARLFLSEEARLILSEEDRVFSSIAMPSPDLERKRILSSGARSFLSAVAVAVLSTASVEAGKAAFGAMTSGQQTERTVVELIVTGDDVRLRSGPSKGTAILAHLKSGTKVVWLAEEGEWRCVRFSDGDEDWVGWVHNDYLQKA